MKNGCLDRCGLWLRYLLLGFLALAGGCSGARPEEMVPQTLTAHQPRPGSVSVQLATANPAWGQDLSNDAFKTAVESSLEKSRLFTSVNKSGKGNFVLEISILDVDEPPAGFDMTVVINADWRLIRASTDRVIWKKQIDSTYTASFSDAFAGPARLRLADEGAARENIRKAMDALAQAPPFQSE